MGAEAELEQLHLFAGRRQNRATLGGTTYSVPGCYNSTNEDLGRELGNHNGTPLRKVEEQRHLGLILSSDF